MGPRRISASSYSNTAPLVWSFLYGTHHGETEVILDSAPARSADLLASGRVDCALVPVIAYQFLSDVRLVPDVCVGAREKVRSVRLVTSGLPLEKVKSVALDTSSKTSVCLAKIIFREFFNSDPKFRPAAPDLSEMLVNSDCALLIGDPALALTAPGVHEELGITSFDIVEIWRNFTGFGFVFAMWMTKKEYAGIDLWSARDEGLRHINEIVSNYDPQIRLGAADFHNYLTNNISYSIDVEMMNGLKLYFALAAEHGLIETDEPLVFTRDQ